MSDNLLKVLKFRNRGNRPEYLTKRELTETKKANGIILLLALSSCHG